MHDVLKLSFNNFIAIEICISTLRLALLFINRALVSWLEIVVDYRHAVVAARLTFELTD